MALQLHSADYPFLAHPHPGKKRVRRTSLESAPAQASPCRRSRTSSAIAAWAAHVQPGSPASLSPRSPYQHSPPRKARCSSITSTYATSTSFLHIVPTPTIAYAATPSLRDFKADLTKVGYTSVFLQLPNTPISAALSLSPEPPSRNPVRKAAVLPIPLRTHKSRAIPRFRSFSVLRSRATSKSACPNSPTKMKAKVGAAPATISKRKKAKYALRPPPLDNELALMQFVDGGSRDSNIKRIVEGKAKATGAAGVCDVYRDGEGGIWWDQDEELEYSHLLAEGDESCPHGAGGLQWVTFGGNASSGVHDEDRRGSVSTHNSDLDPKYVVRPVDSLDGDGLGNATTPPRPHRAAPHLRKEGFPVDAAFPRHAFPKSPKSLTSPGVVTGAAKLKGKARRRPVPLQLPLPSPASKLPTNSPIDVHKARKDFIDASFEPACSVPESPATAVSMSTPVDSRVGNSRGINALRRTGNNGLGIMKKPSMLNMMGLFRSTRKEGTRC